MNSILQNQKPVEFFSAERIKIEIEGQQILWRDMTLKIDSKIGEKRSSWQNTKIPFISGSCTDLFGNSRRD